MQAFIGNCEGTAEGALSLRKQVWIAKCCPFNDKPGNIESILCGNWCALFEYRKEEGEIILNCGRGRRIEITVKETE